MTWRITTDVTRFDAHAGAFLREDPVHNTVLLSIIDRTVAVGPEHDDGVPSRFGWWVGPGGAVEGAFVCTSRRPLLLGGMPLAAAPELARELAGRQGPLTGVIGVPEAARPFADAWERATGAASEVAGRHRLFRLESLTAPRPLPPGRARIATRADLELILAWHEAFDLEAMGEVHRSVAHVEHRIDLGGLLLWEVDGAAVAMAGRTPEVAGMVRIGPVYTPPEHRGRGYGTAVTAALSASARLAASELLLFTDLANPTSNAIYHRIGYRPVSDRLLLNFSHA